jgi:hypothetical protein
VYPVIGSEGLFCYDKKGLYHNDKAFFIVGENLKFLISVLNSKLSFWFLLTIGSGLGKKGFEFRKIYVENVPIRIPQNQTPFITLCNYMLFLNATEERRESEKELIEFIDKEIIDSLVYELYFEEELGTNLFEFVEPYLMDIEKIGDDEARLKAIEEVVEKVRKDGKVTREIERMKGHEWVRVVERNL